MECPECGQDNPSGANYCSKCLANLVMGPGGYPLPQAQAPSEWRGRPPVRREELARKVQQKSHRARLELLVYGGIVGALVVALVLCVTVWGNPMPKEVASGFMSALNERDAGAVLGYAYSPKSAASEALVEGLIEGLGAEGSFRDLTYAASEQDNYVATVSLTGGTFSPGGPSLEVTITADSRLYIGLENHEGHWYVDLTRVNVFP